MAIGFTDRSNLQPDTKLDRLKPVELDCTLVKEKPLAILVEDESGSQAWLPLKYVTKRQDGMFGALRITIPTWLAIEKGLRAEAGKGQGRLF
jgi:hypothetical protein